MRTRILYAVALLSLGSCATTRPLPEQGPPLSAAPVQVRLDSAALPLALSIQSLPPYLVPAPAGSSPRQRRQWQKAQTQNLARAGVLPAKVKNSSVATAPGATAVNHPASAVATGSGAATDARKAGKGHGASAVGPGAVATATSSGTPWWVYLIVAVVGAAGWELLSAKVAPVHQLLRWRVV